MTPQGYAAGMRVVIVEGEAATARTMRWILDEGGFEPAAAKSADEVTAEVSRAPTAAVILSVDLPPDAKARWIERIRAEAPVRILDLHSAAEHGAVERRARFDACLHRPFDADTLLETLRGLVTDTGGGSGSHAA